LPELIEFQTHKKKWGDTDIFNHLNKLIQNGGDCVNTHVIMLFFTISPDARGKLYDLIREIRDDENEIECLTKALYSYEESDLCNQIMPCEPQRITRKDFFTNIRTWDESKSQRIRRLKKNNPYNKNNSTKCVLNLCIQKGGCRKYIKKTKKRRKRRR